MLGDLVDDSEQELVLRKPYLAQAEASLAASQAAMAKAKLDVARCSVRAPFNAVIQDKFVDLGSQVGPSGALLSVIGTDEFWVDVKVSEENLKWFDIPVDGQDGGSSVTIRNGSVWGDEDFRQGQVLRLMGQLETQGRQAQLLVSVKDPLCLKSEGDSRPKLLVGSFVSVEIAGKPLKDVFAIRRDHLHDGNFVWVMNDQSRLEIRPVTIVFRGPEVVYVTDGIADGEKDRDE